MHRGRGRGAPIGSFGGRGGGFRGGRGGGGFGGGGYGPPRGGGGYVCPRILHVAHADQHLVSIVAADAVEVVEVATGHRHIDQWDLKTRRTFSFV